MNVTEGVSGGLCALAGFRVGTRKVLDRLPVVVAGPLRFRRSNGTWSSRRVRLELLEPLDANLGASMAPPWFAPPDGYEARRFDVDNGDFALFVWTDGAADQSRGFWLGNTETPQTLWRTDKYTFEAVPYAVARWAQRELLADIRDREPWLAEYHHLTWFFLPVLLSKDGRESTVAFFRDHAAGFPDASREEGLGFYERFLSTGVLDEYRYTMAAKLGTSREVDPVRMGATMSEFTAAKILADADLSFEPEVELDSGYALDFVVGPDRSLVEVTRPQPPGQRAANTPVAAVRATSAAKTDGQLAAHEAATLFVDCTGFRDDEWNAVRGERPAVGHEPAVIFRARPNGRIEGYKRGASPVDLDAAIEWV